MKKEISRITAVLLTCTLGTLSALVIRNYDKISFKKEQNITYNFSSFRWYTKGANAIVHFRIFNDDEAFRMALLFECGIADTRVQGLTRRYGERSYCVYLKKSSPDEVTYHELTHIAQLIVLDNGMTLSEDLEPTAYILGQLVDELDDILL